MKTLQLLVLTSFLAFAAASASGQIATYQDSAQFDDDFARLRDVDFEDMYAVTVDRMTIRNPYAIESLFMYDQNQQPTDDVILWLSQGATVTFPTRTRTVVLQGYGNPYYVYVTTFADSTYMLDSASFPRTITDENGIARIQIYGTDGYELDINWHAGLYSVAGLDAAGDTVTYSNFDELPGDRYFVLGEPFDVSGVEDVSLIQPIEFNGITVDEPNIGFTGVHFSYFEARPDPDNPIGNLGVVFYPGAKFSFPQGTEGALLVLEQIHIDDTVVFEVTDYDDVRDTVVVVGAGREYDTTWVEEQRATYAHVGFGATAGIKNIRLLGAWTMAPYDIIDTVINGEQTELVLYEPALIETYVMAVHIAEVPPTEIAMIHADVDEIDRAGYLRAEQSAQLEGELQEAKVFAEAGDKENAVGLLKEFGGEVDRLYNQGIFVDEEARKLRNDAAYVISRLQIGTLSAPSGPVDDSLLLSLSDIRMEGNGLRAFYHIPEGNTEEVVISDIQGRIVRRILLNDGTKEGEFFWDMQDETGRNVSAGTYLLSLGSGRHSATAKVVLVR